jgi:hypothetical protein
LSLTHESNRISTEFPLEWKTPWANIVSEVE